MPYSETFDFSAKLYINSSEKGNFTLWGSINRGIGYTDSLFPNPHFRLVSTSDPTPNTGGVRLAYQLMSSKNKIFDRQIGRNAQLFAESLSNLKTKEERYPYVRILVSIIEQAHPEWNQAPTKDTQIAQLATMLSGSSLDKDEIAEVVRVRDEERGLTPATPAS